MGVDTFWREAGSLAVNKGLTFEQALKLMRKSPDAAVAVDMGQFIGSLGGSMGVGPGAPRAMIA
jgi:hypothetical protein